MERWMARERVEMERRLAAKMERFMAAGTERRVTECWLEAEMWRVRGERVIGGTVFNKVQLFLQYLRLIEHSRGTCSKSFSDCFSRTLSLRLPSLSLSSLP